MASRNLPRPTAPIQITAEQILREAREMQKSEIRRPTKLKINDPAELAHYRLRKRKEFEDQIRRDQRNTSVWINYAHWEESQNDFARARSVWERALEVGYRNISVWLKYAEFEMKNQFVNVARNVCIERARGIFERFVQCHPKATAWIQYAKFEMKNGEIARARNCYELAVERLADDEEEAEQLYAAFAEFEELCKESERARCIYKFGLDHIPKGRAEELNRKFVAFEKQYG